MRHALEFNSVEREYFERANKHGKAVWRRIVRVTTGNLPSWAEVATLVRVVTRDRVVTEQVVTTDPNEIQDAATMPTRIGIVPLAASLDDSDAALNAAFS